MAQDSTQPNSSTPGFLVKDAQGNYRKVSTDSVLDLDTDQEEATTPSSPSPESPPSEKPAPATLEIVPPAQQTQQKPPSPPPPAVHTAAAPVSPPPSPVAPSRAGSIPAPSQPLGPQQSAPESGEKEGEFIDAEDEAEIKQHTAALERMVTQPGLDLPVTIQTIVEKIIHEHELQFENDIMLKRFTKVVESRLRNIRNSVETLDVLQRPSKIGGLDIAKDTAQHIVDTIEREAQILHQRQPAASVAHAAEASRQNAATEKKPVTPMAPPPPPFVPRPGAVQKQTTQQPASVDQGDQPAAAPLSPSPDTSTEDTAALAEEIQQEIDTASQQPGPAASPDASPVSPADTAAPHELYGQSDSEMPRITPVQKDKHHMVDIRQPAQAVGPVEEIRQIDLKQFRRMGANPTESAEKVQEKIELLQEESWAMRVQGIRAWKQSPVIQLYTDIGRDSMMNHRPVTAIINDRKENKQPFLLYEEFMAINQMNMQMVI